jgi:hypothetical protein
LAADARRTTLIKADPNRVEHKFRGYNLHEFDHKSENGFDNNFNKTSTISGLRKVKAAGDLLLRDAGWNPAEPGTIQ